jgi:hypothetical protein
MVLGGHEQAKFATEAPGTQLPRSPMKEVTPLLELISSQNLEYKELTKAG